MYAVERPCCRDLLSLSPRSSHLSPSFFRTPRSRVSQGWGRVGKGGGSGWGWGWGPGRGTSGKSDLPGPHPNGPLRRRQEGLKSRQACRVLTAVPGASSNSGRASPRGTQRLGRQELEAKDGPGCLESEAQRHSRAGASSIVQGTSSKDVIKRGQRETTTPLGLAIDPGRLVGRESRVSPSHGTSRHRAQSPTPRKHGSTEARKHGSTPPSREFVVYYVVVVVPSLARRK